MKKLHSSFHLGKDDPGANIEDKITKRLPENHTMQLKLHLYENWRET